MAINFSCSCGRILRAGDELAGKRTKCPQCGLILTIPAAEKPVSQFEDEAFAFLEPHPAPRPQQPEPARELYNPEPDPRTNPVFRPPSTFASSNP